MTNQEVSKLIFTMKAMWPRAYQNLTGQDFQNMIAVWSFALSDYTYEQASNGLKVFMQSSKGFPPDSGQLIGCINRLRQKKEDALTESEAWLTTYKALGSFSWNDKGSAEKAFNKLPEACRRAIGGTVEEFRKVAAMDTSDAEFAIVEARFNRSYTEAVKQRKQYMELPKELRGAEYAEIGM